MRQQLIGGNCHGYSLFHIQNERALTVGSGISSSKLILHHTSFFSKFSPESAARWNAHAKMNPPNALDTCAGTTQVQQWQLEQTVTGEDSDATAKTGGNGEIASLCQALTEIFRDITHDLPKHNNVNEETRINLERSCCALILWSDGYGIAKGNFDDVFSRCRKLRHRTTQALSHIGEVLTERKCHVSIYAE
jgi:hypothetical protein